MADDSAGKSIADAYRNWSPDSATVAPSVGASIADAYRAQAASAPPAAKSWQDEYFPAPDAGDIQPDPRVTAAIGRVGQAAAEGWRGGTMQTPEAYAENQRTLLGQYVANPLVELGNLPFRALGALGRGGAQAIYEAGEPAGRAMPEIRIPDITLPGDSSITYPGGITIDRPGRGFGGTVLGGPGLGRDLNLLAQVAPVAQAEGSMMRSAMQPPVAPEVNALRPAFVSERFAPPRPPGMTDAERIQQLIRHDEAESTGAGPQTQAGAPPAPVPAPAAGAGAVQPAGAQVTTEPIPPKTQTERVRDLEKAVNQTAEDRAGPQMRDDTAYVQGIPPRLLAGRDFSTSVNALDEKVAVAQDRGFRDAVDKNNRSRNEGMVDLLRGDAKDATALDVAHDARSQVSPAEMRVFENEQPTDAAGLVSRIDKYLGGPEGKQKAVRNTLTDVRASLFDADGNLEVLPSRLYGARKNLTDLLKKGVKGTGDVADDVRASKHILEKILPDLDETITGGAPRFTEYLKAWSDMSKPIDQLEFLQQYQTGPKKLTNDAGYLQPTKVQKMLDDIHQANKARGVNKGKSLTDEQIANIEAVRNELAAQQLQDRLASVRGSDTFQQLNNALRNRSGAFGGLAKDAVIHTLLAPTAGIGNLIYEKGAKPWMAARRERQATEAAAARRAELLSPPNPLIQP